MRVGVAEADELDSLSGMVASRTQDGVLYAHPDHGGPIFFAMAPSGQILARFRLSGLQPTDLEDIAATPESDGESFLFLADTGNNAARPGSGSGRAEVQVYRVAEPTVPDTPAAAEQVLENWERLRFTYPDRPHDGETLLVDPETQDLYIVTREQSGTAMVFRAPAGAGADAPAVLEKIAEIPLGDPGSRVDQATAGDISPSGDRALLRTYAEVLLWVRPPDMTWASVFAGAPLRLMAPNEPQSEAITFARDGRSWYSSGEQEPAIYQATETCP